MDIIIFDVGLGQCIFFYPTNYAEYGLMIDCGSRQDFNPIDKIIEWNLLAFDQVSRKHKLKNLTLTNYDQDHFSGLPYLKTKVQIETVKFPKNLTGDEIKRIKPVVTQPVKDVVEILETYNSKAANYSPPYTKYCFFLSKADFPGEQIDTNKLSQLVFVAFNHTCICIPGDLTVPAWEKHLQNGNVTALLSASDIFIASHHGREDGFNEKVFLYCNPECVILSDKHLIHGTQEGMSSKYGGIVQGNGIVLNGDVSDLRKTLTTRNDGHIWIKINADGTRTYKTL